MVGAGAAGLAAARDLAEAGVAVVLLEARPRPGGRVDTRRDGRLGIPIEHGAEFVHGRPPVMTALARLAHARLREVDGRVLAWDRGRLRPAGGAFTRMQELLALGEGDGPFSEVLASPAALRFTPLQRRLARGFVEGYYLAAPQQQGRAALRAMSEAEDAIGAGRAFRCLEGQAALLAPLVDAVLARGALRLGTRVERVRWQPGRVSVRARSLAGGASTLRAERLVVTLPVGLLAAGAIVFAPELRDHRRAAARLQMGSVVKVVVRFRSAFWERGSGARLRDRRGTTHLRRPRARPPLAFALAPGLPIPTWWTLHPLDAPILVGWAGGPAATRLSGTSERRLAHLAIGTLARVFSRPRAELEDLLDGFAVADWSADPLAGGAYAVFPPGASSAPAELARPEAGTIFFAGEATTLAAAGTVHGAIESGRRAAREVVESLGAIRHVRRRGR